MRSITKRIREVRSKRLRRQSVVIGAVVGVLVLFSLLAFAFHRTAEGACSGNVLLARMNDVEIRRSDVVMVEDRVRATGKKVEAAQALRETLWEEHQRQALGLPRRIDPQKGREVAVRAYRSYLLHGNQPLPVRGQVPPDAKLTACGTKMLRASAPFSARAPASARRP